MAYTNPIEEDIRSGAVKRFYLLGGTEEYLKKQYRRKLEEYWLPEGDTMNLAVFTGENVTVEQLAETAETMPFFAERRVLAIVDSGFFKNAPDGLTELLSTAPETAVFLFAEKEIDKRGRLYKFVKEHGTVCDFSEQSEDLLTGWIAGRLKKNGRTVSARTVRELINRCGTDMNVLDREMEKLVSYTMGRREITEADLEAVSVRKAEDRVFEMIDALSAGNKKKALMLYYDLLRLKEAPLKILALIERQYRILLIVKDVSGAKKTNAEIASLAGAPAFTVNKYKKIAGQLPAARIHAALEACAGYEEDVKTGRLADTLSVELFLAEYGTRKED